MWHRIKFRNRQFGNGTPAPDPSFDPILDSSAKAESRMHTKRDMFTGCTRLLSELEKVSYTNSDFEFSVKKTNDLILKEISFHREKSSKLLRAENISNNNMVSSNLPLNNGPNQKRFKSIGEIKMRGTKGK